MSNSVIKSIQEAQAEVFGDVTSWNCSGSIPIGARPTSSLAYQNNGAASGLELDMASLSHATGAEWGSIVPEHYGSRDGYFDLKRVTTGSQPDATFSSGNSRYALDEDQDAGYRLNSPVIPLYRPFMYLAIKLAGLAFKLTPKPRQYNLNVYSRSVYPEWDCAVPWLVGLTNRADPTGESWHAGIPLADLASRIAQGVPNGTFRGPLLATLEDLFMLALTRDTQDVFDSLWENEGLLLNQWFRNPPSHFDNAMFNGLPTKPYGSDPSYSAPSLSADGSALIIPENVAWWTLPDDCAEKGILLRSLYERAALTAPPVNFVFAGAAKLLPFDIVKVEGGPVVANANEIVCRAEATLLPAVCNVRQQMKINKKDGRVLVKSETKSETPTITDPTDLTMVYTTTWQQPFTVGEDPDDGGDRVPISTPQDPEDPSGGGGKKKKKGDDDGEDVFTITDDGETIVETLLEDPAIRDGFLHTYTALSYPAYGTTSRNAVMHMAAMLTKQGAQCAYDPEAFDLTDYEPNVDGASVKKFERYAFDSDACKAALSEGSSYMKVVLTATRSAPDAEWVYGDPTYEEKTFSEAVAEYREGAPGLWAPIPTIAIDGSDARYCLVLKDKCFELSHLSGDSLSMTVTRWQAIPSRLDELEGGNALEYSIRRGGTGYLVLTEEEDFQSIEGTFADTSYKEGEVLIFGKTTPDWKRSNEAVDFYIAQLILADKLDKASIEGMITPIKPSDRRFPWWIIILIIALLLIFALIAGSNEDEKKKEAANKQNNPGASNANQRPTVIVVQAAGPQPTTQAAEPTTGVDVSDI